MTEAPFASPGETRKLARLVAASLGRFRAIAIVCAEHEVAEGAAWLRANLAQVATGSEDGLELIEVDLSELRGANLLDELRAKLPGSLDRKVLVLTGLDTAERRTSRRTGLARQLNVQRDALVVAVPCPWILFMSPTLHELLGSIAPDFSDFLSLRIGLDRTRRPQATRGLSHHAALQARDLLAGLLAGFYTPQELRRLLSQLYGRELTSVLPGDGASGEQLAFAAVDALRRRGLLDERLFNAMIESRPAHQQTISTTQSQFLPHQPSAAPAIVGALLQLTTRQWQELLYRLQMHPGLMGWSPEDGAARVVERIAQEGRMPELESVLSDLSSTRYS